MAANNYSKTRVNSGQSVAVKLFLSIKAFTTEMPLFGFSWSHAFWFFWLNEDVLDGYIDFAAMVDVLGVDQVDSVSFADKVLSDCGPVDRCVDPAQHWNNAQSVVLEADDI